MPRDGGALFGENPPRRVTNEPVPVSDVDTKPERRKVLKDAVDGVESLTKQKESPEARNLRQAISLAEKAGVSKERTDLETVGATRKEALKEFLRAEEIFKKIKEPTEEQKSEFEAARATFAPVNESYTAAQLTYATALQGSVRERLTKEGKSEEERDRIISRYNKWIRTKEVIIPRVKQEQDAREELLDEPGRNFIKKGLRWYQKANKKIENRWKDHYSKKIGLTEVEAARKARFAARATRVVGFGALGMLAGSTAAVAGGAAVLGSTALWAKLVWSGSSLVLGSAGGWYAGNRFSESKSAERAAYKEAVEGDITSAEDIEKQQQAHALGSEEAIDKGRAKRENLFALFSSLGLSGSALIHSGALESVANAWSWLRENMSIEAHASTIDGNIPTFTTGAPAVHEAPSNVTNVNAASVEETPTFSTGRAIEHAQHAETVEPAPPIAGAGIQTEGEGTNQLFLDMKAHIRAALDEDFRASASTPALRHFMDANVNTLSREVGPAFGENGMTMHMGDRFFLDENQNVWFAPVNGDPQLFIENNPDLPDGYEVHHLHQATAGTEAPEAASQTSETSAQPLTARVETPETIATGTNDIPPPTARVDAPPAEAPPQAAAEAGRVRNLGDLGTGTPEPEVAPHSPASPAQAQAPTQRPAATGTGHVYNLGDLGVEGADAPAAGEAAGSAAPAAAIPDAVPRGGVQNLGDMDAAHTAQETAAGGTAQLNPATWVAEQGFPEHQNAVFTVNPESQLASLFGDSNVVYAHAETPEKSLALAQEYGMKHPDTKIAFDNSEEGGWLRGKTERVGVMEINRYGQVKSFEPSIRDTSGEVIKRVGPAEVQRWIT